MSSELPATDPARPDAPDQDPAPQAAGLPRLSGVAPEHRHAIVVGASSGMGAALVRQLAREGYRVAALARREAKLLELADAAREEAAAAGGAVLVRAHDAADTAAVPALFEELVEELGGLDLLIYAAGIMPEVGAEEYDTAVDLEIVQVNLAGCMAWCNAGATFFGTQRRGTIVGISSIAGDRGRKGSPAYCTSKAAMNTYLEALRNRLAEKGAHVCTIRPGYIDTAMTQGVEGLFWVISPEDAASQILAAARNRVNTRYVPLRWQAVGTVLKLIPSAVFRHLSF